MLNLREFRSHADLAADGHIAAERADVLTALIGTDTDSSDALCRRKGCKQLVVEEIGGHAVTGIGDCNGSPHRGCIDADSDGTALVGRVLCILNDVRNDRAQALRVCAHRHRCDERLELR